MQKIVRKLDKKTGKRVSVMVDLTPEEIAEREARAEKQPEPTEHEILLEALRDKITQQERQAARDRLINERTER